MKNKILAISIALLSCSVAFAQIGAPYIHDPSTVVECDGKYYTFGTGGGGLISEDGWSWHSGGVRPGVIPCSFSCTKTGDHQAVPASNIPVLFQIPAVSAALAVAAVLAVTVCSHRSKPFRQLRLLCRLSVRPFHSCLFVCCHLTLFCCPLRNIYK